MPSLHRLAYSTLLPVVIDLDIHEDIFRFLENGGRSILFGETADEYATGVISPKRIQVETAERWRETLRELRRIAGPMLIALDTDISAVHRLHSLTPPLPTLDEAYAMTLDEFENRIYEMAAAAKSLGVNLLFSPTADVVSGKNAWLNGKTLGPDISAVSRLVDAYVRGISRAGIGSTVKHFPGHPIVSGVPAIEDAYVPLTMTELTPYLAPFKAGIDAGAAAVMMGPAVFKAVNPPTAGSISADLIGLLRKHLNFNGLVVTCDLDHRATMQDRGVAETAVRALVAGADLLLLSPKSVPHLPAIAAEIASAVDKGRLPLIRLEGAAAAVNHTISKMSA